MDIQEHTPLTYFRNDRQAARLGDARGLTMVELMVTLAVILIITAAASTAYVKLLRGVKVQGRITENQMDTLCGFELLRYDVEMAGYGLFRQLPPNEPECATQPPAFTYEEADDSDAPNAAAFNDASGVARAFVFSNNTGNTLSSSPPDNNASDVLVIKSMVASAQAVDRKWSFLDSNGTIKAWGDAKLDFTDNDTVVALDESGALRRTCSDWKFAADGSSVPLLSEGDTYVVYGVNSSTARMPFNRVDYYLKKPVDNFPSRCFAGSFILYRASINHGDGARNEQPLIDCVRDFQVAFGIDTDGDQAVNSWGRLSLADANGNGSVSADEIRAGVREVRVFVLYHEGQRDNDFWFSGTLNLGDAQITGNAGFQMLSSAPLTGALSTFTPAGDARHYRWKIDKLAIKPMNLD